MTTTRRRPPAAERDLRVWAAALLAASLAIHGWDLSAPGLLDRTGRLKGPDYLQFFTYGALVLEGRGHEIYDPQAHAEVARTRVDPRLGIKDFHPNYSPIVAWMMAPLAALPYLASMALFSLGTIGLYALAVGTLGRRFLPGHAITLALVAATWPVFFTVLRYGQLSALLLALLTAAVVLDANRRAVLSGVCLGLLAFKPTLLVVPILILLLAGQWPLLMGAVFGAAAETTLGALLAGPQAMRDYGGTLAALAARPELVQIFPAESHSLRGAARLAFGDGAAATALGLAAIVVTAGFGAWIWRRTNDDRVRWSALALGTLLGSVHLLTYDLLLAAVPLVLMTAYALETKPPGEWRWMATLAVIYAGAWPGTLIARLTGIQLSTLGMALALAWLARCVRRPRSP